MLLCWVRVVCDTLQGKNTLHHPVRDLSFMNCFHLPLEHKEYCYVKALGPCIAGFHQYPFSVIFANVYTHNILNLLLAGTVQICPLCNACMQFQFF